MYLSPDNPFQRLPRDIEWEDDVDYFTEQICESGYLRGSSSAWASRRFKDDGDEIVEERRWRRFCARMHQTGYLKMLEETDKRGLGNY